MITTINAQDLKPGQSTPEIEITKSFLTERDTYYLQRDVDGIIDKLMDYWIRMGIETLEVQMAIDSGFRVSDYYGRGLQIQFS
jgi:hypothetical protein